MAMQRVIGIPAGGVVEVKQPTWLGRRTIWWTAIAFCGLFWAWLIFS